MKLAENRFLSGPRAGAGAVAANVFFSFTACGAATGGAEFALARTNPQPVGAAGAPPGEFYGE